MAAVTLGALRETVAARIGQLGACSCGVERRPVRVVRGGLSLLVCGRCGKLTTERKEGR